MNVLRDAVENFFIWVAGYDNTKNGVDPGWAVHDYVMQWLTEADQAVETVAGNYATFLKTLVLIAEECHRDPSALDLFYKDEHGNQIQVSRQPTYEPYWKQSSAAPWADKDEFNQLVYDRHHLTGHWSCLNPN